MKNLFTFEEFLNEETDYNLKGLGKSTKAKKSALMAKQAAMDDDDPDAYKEMPGDTKGKKGMKTSQHTSKYDKMFKKNEDTVYEEEDFQFLVEADEPSTDRSPLDNEAVETGLKNKSKETGCPIGVIRACFRRGMAAWKSGHRPGVGQEQWSYARVNSFLTGAAGTWGKTDSDLADEAKKAGYKP